MKKAVIMRLEGKPVMVMDVVEFDSLADLENMRRECERNFADIVEKKAKDTLSRLSDAEKEIRLIEGEGE